MGHETVINDRHGVQTGVTVVIPRPGNAFREKTVSACHVINGFGKSTGLLQIDELGQIESPIALTNTFSVPAVTEGVLDFLLEHNPDIGVTTGSANTVVAECNDGRLNDIRGRHVTRFHVARALARASQGPVEQGAVGAGRGMSAFGLKGGIGSASRRVSLGDIEPVVGVIVLSNFGKLGDLVVAGRPVGRWLAVEQSDEAREDGAGSVIVVLATDAPVCARQLGRLLRRVQNGLARTGSLVSHSSGELAIGFSTSAVIDHLGRSSTRECRTLVDSASAFDPLFRAVAEATEEAVLNSVFNATTVVGNLGIRREAFPIERLEEFMERSLAT